MGIQGLHKGLNFATQKTTLRDFRGKTLAVDASSWLHRSVYSVSEKYVEGIERGIIDKQCVGVSAKYVTSRCRELLQAFQIAQIFLVMDGKRCPLKADCNGERELRRQANLKEARAFKTRGRNDKAEEKYKTCIKIKDELTEQVMAEVKRSFQNDKRVHLIWSPYEADAQLAKLCVDGAADAVITEDSDVLVYSAAAHFAFPIIFKLDRRTGTCDVISMDWLLSSDENPAPTATAGKTPPSALETLLRNLASRQARRPGFGVRLFVQGCVLAGCDYAPNKLSGVGLVNAFKHVRDNAFRNDSVRFSKVLDGLPKKNKVNIINTEAYELNLAKSEAVFYYHIVRYQDRSKKPLCDPHTSEPDKDATHSHTHHFPLMERFEDDWSFLGDITEADQADEVAPPIIEIAPPIKEIAFFGKGVRRAQPVARGKEASTVPAMFASKKVAPARNPYAKPGPVATKKRPRQDNRTPLDTIHPNSAKASSHPSSSNHFFAKFARTASQMSKHGQQSIESFPNTKEEVRFVKRHFPSENDRTLGLAGSSGRSERPCRKHTSERGNAAIGCNEGTAITAGFECNAPNEMILNDDSFPPPGRGELRSTDDHVSSESLSEPSSDEYPMPSDQKGVPPSFFDLTDSNSGPFCGNFEGVEDDDGFSKRPARVSLDDSIDMRPKALPEDSGFREDPSPDYDFQLPDASPQENELTDLALESSFEAPTRVPNHSKYFSGSTGTAKEMSHLQHPPIDSSAEARRRDPKSVTPRTKRSLLEADEVIDSPDESGMYTSNLAGARSAGIKSTRLDNSFRSRPPPTRITTRGPQSGPLVDGFRKQREASPSSSLPSQRKPWVRSFPPLGGRKSSSTSTTKARNGTPQIPLTSYFSVKKQNPADFNQLRYNTNQTEDDFLWDGS